MPACLCSLAGYAGTLGLTQPRCPSWPALATAKVAAHNCRWVATIFGSVLDLACGDIDDQLPELDRVAWAGETLGCHALNMARSPASANPAPTRPKASL